MHLLLKLFLTFYNCHFIFIIVIIQVNLIHHIFNFYLFGFKGFIIAVIII